MRLLVTTQTIDKHDPVLGFFHGWVTEFAKHFDHVDVICLKKGTYEFPPHVLVHSLGKEEGESRLKYVLRFYRYFWQLYMHNHVDYVFFHMGAIYNILAAPFFLIRTFRQTQFYWWKTHGKVGALKERLALRCVDRVYTAGAKSFDRKTDKLRVVGHAVNTDLFSVHTHGTHTITHMLMVGRIVPIKKIEVALRAAVHITQAKPEVTLELIGAPDNSAYEEILKSYAHDQGLSSVTFKGAQPQSMMPITYAHAGILLHPAYEAGFDKVVLEAMSSGVIPITSIPSFEPILAPFGLFVEKENDAEYAAVALRIMAMEESERETLREKLREIVVRDHSLTTLPQRIFG